MHVTSRCRGLFPPHPFFKGKALGTRLQVVNKVLKYMAQGPFWKWRFLQKWRTIAKLLTKFQWNGKGVLLELAILTKMGNNYQMNDFSVIGDPSFAPRILGSPGDKHCESLQRSVWRRVVSLLKAVSLGIECRILPWFYEKWRWLMSVRWNVKFLCD